MTPVTVWRSVVDFVIWTAGHPPPCPSDDACLLTLSPTFGFLFSEAALLLGKLHELGVLLSLLDELSLLVLEAFDVAL